VPGVFWRTTRLRPGQGVETLDWDTVLRRTLERWTYFSTSAGTRPAEKPSLSKIALIISGVSRNDLLRIRPCQVRVFAGDICLVSQLALAQSAGMCRSPRAGGDSCLVRPFSNSSVRENIQQFDTSNKDAGTQGRFHARLVLLDFADD